MPDAAAPISAAEVVQRQLDAYNAHDLAAFVATYAEDAELTRVGGVDAPVAGRRAIAELYASRVFNRPGHRAELLGRLACGNKVVDHERVFGLSDEPFEALAVYEVTGDLIRKVWFFAAA
jgi:hypothetical protein